MKEEAVEIRTVDGTADGFLYGNGENRGPGFLFLTDIGGIRPSQREMAARLAGEGYTVLLPNMFYRTHRVPLFEGPMNFADEATRRRFGELKAALPPDAIERDAAGYAGFLAARSGPAARSRMARTDGSADVDATASFQPASWASPMMRRMPGRGGSLPAATISV